MSEQNNKQNKVKRRFGDRRDGRRVKAPGLQTVMAYLMPKRTDCEVYLNDQLVLSPDATAAGHEKYENIMYECAPWTLDAGVGDEVKLTFICEDEYGLGYEFVMQKWMIEENGPNNSRLDELPYNMEDEFPKLRWD